MTTPPTSSSQPPAAPTVGFLPSPLVSAIAIGLTAGVAEGFLMLVARYLLHHYTHRDLQLLWSVPLSLAILSIVASLPLLKSAWRPAATKSRALVIGVAVFIGMAELTLLADRIHPLARLVLAAGAAKVAVDLAQRFPRQVGGLVRLCGAVTLVLTMAAPVWLYGGSALRARRAEAVLPAAAPGAPNILLLILDTMRAADMSLYGSPHRTTPKLERFASRGVVFDRAYSPSSWTLPSHAAMFTGLPAHRLAADWDAPLEDGVPTLAEALASRGYRTAGFTGNLRYTTDESGLDRGFARYTGYRLTPSVLFTRTLIVSRALGWYAEHANHPIPLAYAPARDIRHDVMRWLPASDRPWFAFVNLFDAHDPYLPPESLAVHFRTPGAAPRNPFLRNEAPVTPAEAQGEHDAYVAAVAHLDDELGLLLDALEARGALANTLVVVAGDHGELFGEHGLLNHGNSLYAALLHVPLVVVWPGHVPQGVRVAEPVSGTDIAATIMELAGAAGALPGRSLAPRWSGATLPPDTIVASVRFAARQPSWFPVASGDMMTVIVGGHQLVRQHDGKEEAFDLLSDPLGARTAAPGALDDVTALRAVLAGLR